MPQICQFLTFSPCQFPSGTKEQGLSPSITLLTILSCPKCTTTAFVLALSSAAVTHQIAKACSSGQLANCPCGHGGLFVDQQPYIWSDHDHPQIYMSQKSIMTILPSYLLIIFQISLIRSDSQYLLLTIISFLPHKYCKGLAGWTVKTPIFGALIGWEILLHTLVAHNQTARASVGWSAD